MRDRPDFRALKARISILDVLARCEVQLKRVNQHELRGRCPLPMHSPESKEPTFVVNPAKNVWSCHSASCVAARNTAKNDGASLKKGGDLIEFVKFMEKCSSLREAGERLEDWYGRETNSLTPAAAEAEETFALPAAEEMVNKPLTFELQAIDHQHPYLVSRGFDEEECEYLGVGFFPGRGSMQNRIVFPIHNAEGKLVGYAGRRVEYSLFDEDPTHIAPKTESLDRWKFPAGFYRGAELYNLHRVIAEDWTDVILVESFWGVLACVRAGVMNAVAMMSCTLTEKQAEMLAANFRGVAIMADGDEHGRSAIGSVVAKLVMAEVEHIDILLLPKGVQPDELPPDDLRRFLNVPEVRHAWQLVEDVPASA